MDKIKAKTKCRFCGCDTLDVDIVYNSYAEYCSNCGVLRYGVAR